MLFAARSLLVERAMLATRGKRLVLRRVHMSGEFGAAGPADARREAQPHGVTAASPLAMPPS
jgi:hypothetical protein